MKKLLLISLIIFLLPLVACGKPSDEQEPPASEEVIMDCLETIYAHQNLLKEHEELKVFSEGLQAWEAECINTINALNAENFELKAEAAILTTQKEQLAGSLEQALNELLQAGFEGNTQLERLQEEHDKVLARLRRIEPFYPPRNFPSLSVLREWLANDDTDSVIKLKAGADGVISFEGICDKYAIQLMNRALLDGFKMSFYPMGDPEHYQHYGEKLPERVGHAVNLVIIGNNVYLVDPQNDGVWLKCYLD